MEVSDQIIKVLDNLGQKFGLAIDWTQSNIAPYIQELGKRIVNYELWTSSVWIVFSLMLLISSIFVCKKYCKKAMSRNSEDYEIGIPMFLFSIVGIIISILGIVSQTFDIITCLTLPEKVIFEFVKGYIPR